MTGEWLQLSPDVSTVPAFDLLLRILGISLGISQDILLTYCLAAFMIFKDRTIGGLLLFYFINNFTNLY